MTTDSGALPDLYVAACAARDATRLDWISQAGPSHDVIKVDGGPSERLRKQSSRRRQATGAGPTSGVTA